jgi:hypothetical protein
MTSENTIDTQERLSLALDRAEVCELVDRYIHLLDSADDPERDDEAYRRVFTDDVRLTFPIGQRQGIAGLAEFQRSAYLCWGSTFHLSGNHVVDLDGDRATVRAQVWALHVQQAGSPMGLDTAHRFDVGGFYSASAVRLACGWRIAALEFVVLWTAGQGRPAADYSPALLGRN